MQAAHSRYRRASVEPAAPPLSGVRRRHAATRSRLRAGLAACLLSFAGPAAVAEASTPDFAVPQTAEDTTLVRVGQGTARYARIIPVYDAALYIDAAADPDNLLDRRVAKRLDIVYRTSVKASDMITAAERVLARQQPGHVLERWRSQIDALHAAYRDVRPGDRYALVYRPDDGLRLELNGREITRIAAAEFAQLYFGIWLAEEPLSDSLKQALLSGEPRAP
ncbi:MAG: chalcone isomerase family protein [Gammaproteobacteria bacterium]